MSELLDRLQSATEGSYRLSKLVGDYLGAEERYEHPGSENPSHRCYTTNLQDAVSLAKQAGLHWLELFERAIIHLRHDHPTGPITIDMACCGICAEAIKAHESKVKPTNTPERA